MRIQIRNAVEAEAFEQAEFFPLPQLPPLLEIVPKVETQEIGFNNEAML
jgi:hypothetical protein